ncbi:MAG: transposase [Phycisphaerales bacterium]
MLLGHRLEAFVQKSPISVIVRATLERVFHASHLDALFERTAVQQYTRELLFSTLVALMSEVVLGISRSIRAAYQQAQERPSVSITSVYNKLNGVETAVSAAFVHDSAAHLGPIIRCLGGTAPVLLAGFRVRILDGNHLGGTEHRLQELRSMRAAALPGQTLVVLDPELGLVVDVVACEDGHAQERALLGEVLAMVQSQDLWLGDRNFCTTGFLFGIADRGGFFLIRQHASTLTYTLLGRRKSCGKTASGRVYEQSMLLSNRATGETMQARRITVELDKPTRDGESEIHLVTNVPALAADALVMSDLYLQRWTIETMFQTLTTVLHCEIKALGYPQAALFGFCLAVVAYNAVAVVQASLRAVHSPEIVEKQVSWYYVCTHIAKVYEGMMIAVPARHWRIFREMDEVAFAEVLRQLAQNIDLAKFRKHPRGRKKPRPQRTSGAKIKHVATSRIIAKR